MVASWRQFPVAAGRAMPILLAVAATVLGACAANTATSDAIGVDRERSGTETTQAATPVGGGAGAASSSPAASTAEPAVVTTAPAPPTSGADTEQVPGVAPRGDPAPTVGPATTPTRPDWLGTRVLPTSADGQVVPQTTPPELIDRRFATIDLLPPPSADSFESSVAPLTGDPLARSTWNELCPVTVDELRYVTVSFWGFDDRPHTGELILHERVVADVVTVFETLYQARFPIEEMRIVTPADLDAPPTGDGNNTASFACREVTGGSRFSEHAYGLAIDINPFHNPYVKGELILPELATSYIERTPLRPGMVAEGGVAVAAFDAIGWGWGGRWQSLTDYHHFALNDR